MADWAEAAEQVRSNRVRGEAMSLLCPSAPASASDARVFGLVRGQAEARRVAYLTDPIPMTGEIEASVSPATPNEVLRTTAPCAGKGCLHFDGKDCTLITRIAAMLPAVVERPPPCTIRKDCRWWHQEGVAACLRCPQVVTASSGSSTEFAAAAMPPPQASA